MDREMVCEREGGSLERERESLARFLLLIRPRGKKKIRGSVVDALSARILSLIYTYLYE